MNHIRRVQEALAGEGLDAVLLTGEANRFYAMGYYTPNGDAIGLVSKNAAWFFTDARYTEAAGRSLEGTELLELTPEKPFSDYIQTLAKEHSIRRLGFEDASMSVQAFQRLEGHLDKLESPCETVPASGWLGKLRQSKSSPPWKPPRESPNAPCLIS